MRLPRGHAEIALLWILLAIYAAARVTQAFPDRIPVLLIAALHVLPALFFALIHGSIAYRVRGILVFVLLCLLWGNLSERSAFGRVSRSVVTTLPA
ncbi:MAG TPA: hypothetical protein VK789_09110 [Bryobacteraceae bacterium]|jgi:hypothetical protein|nr:hypothetical protein [Bryobacteraceae bacterium]